MSDNKTSEKKETVKKPVAKKPTAKKTKPTKPKASTTKAKGLSEKETLEFAKAIGFRALGRNKFEEQTRGYFKGKKVEFDYINRTQVFVSVDGVKMKEYYVVK